MNKLFTGADGETLYTDDGYQYKLSKNQKCKLKFKQINYRGNLFIIHKAVQYMMKCIMLLKPIKKQKNLGQS